MHKCRWEKNWKDIMEIFLQLIKPCKEFLLESVVINENLLGEKINDGLLPHWYLLIYSTIYTFPHK